MISAECAQQERERLEEVFFANSALRLSLVARKGTLSHFPCRVSLYSSSSSTYKTPCLPAYLLPLRWLRSCSLILFLPGRRRNVGRIPPLFCFTFSGKTWTIQSLYSSWNQKGKVDVQLHLCLFGVESRNGLGCLFAELGMLYRTPDGSALLKVRL